MGLFVTSTSGVDRHGVFAIENPPPAVVQATGTSDAAIVGQFPWGPEGLYTPTSIADFYDKYAPRGMARTGSAILSVIRRGWPRLKAVRVLGPTAAAASAVVNKTGPVALVTVVLKYKGTEGNSVVVTAKAATDGDSNHFNLEIARTSGSGTTLDIIHNVNVSGVGADVLPTQADIDKLKLVGSVTKNSAGLPILGNTTCTGGLDGTVTATEYVGTAGTGDKGLARLENDGDIRHFFVDDCGNSLRAAVNAGIVAHQALMGDRLGYVNGNSGLTAAQAQTDKANYVSDGIVYVAPWFTIRDDVDDTVRQCPPSSLGASVASQLSPSTSPAWKATVVSNMLACIVALETDYGQQIGTNSKKGIMTITTRKKGGFCFEAGVLTIADSNPAKKNITRTRMGQYIAISVTTSLEEMVDAPNVPENQQIVVNAVDTFLSGLKRNQNNNPNFTPHILDYEMLDLGSANTQVSLDAGDFFVPVKVKTSAGMERIFFQIQFGETVQVSVAA
jgi:hypothetical protein